jgi:FkbM family methyltransferase
MSGPINVTPIERLSSASPALGRECRFALRVPLASAPAFYLEHDGVLYLEPLSVDGDGSVRLYPEAPGRYVLHATWRAGEGTVQWARTQFHIAGEGPGSPPTQVKLEDRTTLWVPTRWDAQAVTAFERPVFRELQKLVRPGMTVYDIGANVGLFSVRLLRWIRPTGWLYAVEPSPVCVSFLRANLGLTGAENFQILPVAISNRRTECAFRLNYANSLIGVTSDSPHAAKPGHELRVAAESLDGLIAERGLRKPDLIKLDVEGAEALAVEGMMETIATARPTLMIELHGRAAASQTLQRLASCGYRYLDTSTGVTYERAEDLSEALPEACVQVIGLP